MLFEKHRLVTLPPAIYPRFVLNEEECVGCARCVNSCPIQLLMINDNKKATPNDRYDHFRCITCQNCVAACPQNAITIEGDYRVPNGFWKNSHLFTGGKTPPLPIPGKGSYQACEPELTETEKIIYNRRSIRLYRKKPVPRELIHRVIEAGRFAPSAGNNQPWKFIVIQNQALIDEIDIKCKKFCRLVMRATLPRAWVDKQVPGDKTARLKPWQTFLTRLLIALRGPNELDPRARGGINAIVSDPDYHTFFHAPALIILLADKRGIGSIELDTGICGQNMVLAAHSLGLGTCWVSLIEGLQGFPKLKKQLGITAPFKIITSLTLGYPRGRVDNIVNREQARVVWHE
jgi:nitroreductase/NAD-dependent dihydropyrimidine dehydrogenase PreA subunit